MTAAKTSPGAGLAASAAPGELHMSERDLENGIRRILKDLPQIIWYHTRDSRGSNPGFPDMVCAGPGGVLFRELKTRMGRLTFQQRAWLDALCEAGADAGEWRPCHLNDGSIARELARCAGLTTTPNGDT